MVLEKDGEDQWDRSCEKLRSVTKSDRRAECPTNNKKRKTNWIFHILSRNCLLKYDIGEKIKGRIKLREDEEEGISSYWSTLRKTVDAGN
jgi:hypothetical protein